LATKKSKSQLEAELKELRKARASEGIVQVLNNLIRWGGIVLIVRYIYLGIDTLSGKSTLADIGVEFLTDINISITIAWLAGIGGLAYGYKQRMLRKDTIERLVGRIQELEGTFDPNRTSSKLTKRGDTRPEDRI
jgi:hypothetical protein